MVFDIEMAVKCFKLSCSLHKCSVMEFLQLNVSQGWTLAEKNMSWSLYDLPQIYVPVSAFL